MGSVGAQMDGVAVRDVLQCCWKEDVVSCRNLARHNQRGRLEAPPLALFCERGLWTEFLQIGLPGGHLGMWMWE